MNTVASNHMLNPRMNKCRKYSFTGTRKADHQHFAGKSSAGKTSGSEIDSVVDTLDDNISAHSLKLNHWTVIENCMQIISSEMKWQKFRRSLVEVCLCESVNGRHLQKKDVFIKNQRIFRLNLDGEPEVREFGPTQSWTAVQTPLQRHDISKPT